MVPPRVQAHHSATTSENTIVPVAASDLELANIPAKHDDPFLVAFEEPYDAENPRCWSKAKKWTVADVMSATGFNRIMLSTIMAPALTTIAQELHMSNTEAVMAMSSYMLAAVFGPLLFGPLSEVYGRAPILHASNIWFLIFNIVCGFAKHKGTLIGARFLSGFGASAVYALGGAVLGDVWRPEQRGKSLSIYQLIPLLGGAVGPIIGAFMAARTTWRWMFWSTSIFQAVMIVISIPAFWETYAPVVLRRRAEKLRAETGDNRYHTAAERVHGPRTARQIVLRSLSRPLRLLATHPAIQCTSLVSGFDYGVLYIVLSTFSDMWTKQYGMPLELSGLHYLALAFGDILGSQIGGPLMDILYRKLTARGDGRTAPEYHLPIMIPATIVGCIGLFIYGWAANFNVHWIVVDIGVIIGFAGYQTAGMPISGYIIDAYPEHASSATAASQFVRSLTAFAFPLAAPKMYAVCGYGWGNSTVAFASLFIGVGAPIFIWFFGARLRARGQSSY